MIPLVAAVVLVQILAPISAVRFIASAIADPVAVAPLCAAMAEPGPTSDSGPLSHGGGCCVICALSLGGAPVPALPPQDFVAARFAQKVVWRLAGAAPIDTRSFAHAQARAPPARIAAFA
ncbi:DUF2946 family protein [Rhodopseudomonas sp. BR0M22]|uniref:DUF2946 family protein n=1 Tax=Rhodopseudomonas sp. BR0M22 TaxID=2269369 RepID=UPI001FF0772B|nr:DUF2946 family protein [Rhodopseudomonas sp. BR0M22]